MALPCLTWSFLPLVGRSNKTAGNKEVLCGDIRVICKSWLTISGKNHNVDPLTMLISSVYFELFSMKRTDIHKLSSLQHNTANIRNLCILAHVDHGQLILANDAVLMGNWKKTFNLIPILYTFSTTSTMRMCLFWKWLLHCYWYRWWWWWFWELPVLKTLNQMHRALVVLSSGTLTN